jgi:hypothetical protein
MSDNLDKYLPEYDENEARKKLAGFSAADLTDMLIRAYKEKRVLAKSLDEMYKKLSRIEDAIHEPSSLLKMPGIPTADDLRRMTEGQED